MALITWVTQPAHPFDSFYYFDTDSLHFVRIRLELGRKDDRPNPGVFARKSRYVGFVDSTAGFDFHDYDRWSVSHQQKIVYRVDEFNSITLSNQPDAGKKVIDFSLAAGREHPEFVHHGNRLVDPPYRLPNNSEGKPVTTQMLRAIALSVMGEDTHIVLCLSTSTAEELGDAIFLLYERIAVVSAE